MRLRLSLMYSSFSLSAVLRPWSTERVGPVASILLVSEMLNQSILHITSFRPVGVEFDFSFDLILDPGVLLGEG